MKKMSKRGVAPKGSSGKVGSGGCGTGKLMKKANNPGYGKSGPKSVKRAEGKSGH